MISQTVLERWFLIRIRRPQAAAQLFCLPYAGGGAAVFGGWSGALGDEVEVNAVALPGRERRTAEEPAIDPVRIAEAIAARADRRYALFGHSMGAALAFEVVRELRRAGSTLPARLFVGGCRPPDRSHGDSVFGGLSKLDDGSLLDRLVAGGGLPVEVLAEPELLELLIPVFRADFAWLDGYEFRPEPPLPTPVTAFAATGDDSALPDVMDGWRRHTAADFALHVLAGGHFFLDDHLALLGEIIRADLLPGQPGARRCESARISGG
jgi:surfactin synthase thioesterase subunit